MRIKNTADKISLQRQITNLVSSPEIKRPMSDSFSYIHHNLTECIELLTSLSLLIYSRPSKEAEVEVEEEEERYLLPADRNFKECSSGAINGCMKAEESLIPN